MNTDFINQEKCVYLRFLKCCFSSVNFRNDCEGLLVDVSEIWFFVMP
jgi:hypothetical protein